MSKTQIKLQNLIKQNNLNQSDINTNG